MLKPKGGENRENKKLEEYYKKVSIMYDNVSERIKMLDGYPITSLKGTMDENAWNASTEKATFDSYLSAAQTEAREAVSLKYGEMTYIPREYRLKNAR